MTYALSPEQRERFADQGYLVVRGLLDVETDLAPVKQSYIQYLDGLADIYMGETNPDLRADFAARPFAERFAILLGCSGGTVLHHLDPTLIIYHSGFRWRPDLPSAQIPELFWLMRNETLLDAVESLIGPEIDASPNYHINLKLAQRHLDLAETVARTSGQENPDRQQFWGFHVANTGWHMDAAYALPNAHDNSMVNAWIPLTDTPEESSCLLVVPGSHRNPILFEPIPDSVVAKAVALPAVPGDVVFFHNRMLHGATTNRTDRDHRWAFNFRYLPIGQTSGPVFLPSFVARSRALPERELRDPLLWSQMWRGGLDYAAINLMPLRPSRTFSQADADAVVAHWRAKISKPEDWLRLGEANERSLLARAGLGILRRFTRRPLDPVDRLLIQKNWPLAYLKKRLHRSPTAKFVLGPLVRFVRRWRIMRADRAASVTLPEDIRIVPPSADVPADLAAYSGVWSGLWWDKAPMMYVFERIEPDGTAQMVYAWPDYQTWEWKSGHQRHEVQLKSDQFSFSNQWGTYRQRILPDGRMRSDYNGSPSHEGSSGRGTAILKRVD